MNSACDAVTIPGAASTFKGSHHRPRTPSPSEGAPSPLQGAPSPLQVVPTPFQAAQAIRRGAVAAPTGTITISTDTVIVPRSAVIFPKPAVTVSRSAPLKQCRLKVRRHPCKWRLQRRALLYGPYVLVALKRVVLVRNPAPKGAGHRTAKRAPLCRGRSRAPCDPCWIRA